MTNDKRSVSIFTIVGAVLLTVVAVLARRVLGDAADRRALAHSLGVALVAVPLGTLLGTCAALAIPRRQKLGAAVVGLILVAVPLAPAMVLLAVAGPLGLGRGVLAVIAAHALLCGVLSGTIVRLGLQRLDPALEETAADLGASAVEIVRRIVLPHAWRSIAAAALVCLALSLSDAVVASLTAPSNWELVGPRVWEQVLAGRATPLAPLIVFVDALLGVCAARLWLGWARATSIGQ